jgi:hypothetical protein
VPDNQASVRLVEHLGERLEGRTVVAGTEYLVYGIERTEEPDHHLEFDEGTPPLRVECPA